VLYGAPAVLVPVKTQLHLSVLDERIEGTAIRELSPALQAGFNQELRRLEEYEDPQEGRRIRNVRVDDSEFHGIDSEGRRAKLGLGLSAAEVVGAIALRYEYAGLSWQAHRIEVMQAAIEAHRSVSGGGSGADIAACSVGRPLLFQVEAGQTRAEVIETTLQKPTLPLNAIWSRQTGDTRELVAQFTAWAESGGSAAEQKIAELFVTATALSRQWYGGDSDELLSGIDAFNNALRECTEAAGMAYMLPVHARYEEWARRHGGRAKPTGAGGGDMILLVGELPLAQLNVDVMKLG
jgi:mevalonate kinase